MNMRTNTPLLAPALLAGVMLFLLGAGGCKKDEGKPAVAGWAPEDRAAAEKGQEPYYHGLIEEYRNVLAEDQHNLAAIIALGNALYDAGQWREAIQYYDRALSMNPHLADVITDMGTCFRNLGMPDKAIAQYERALSIEPVHQGALYNMGIVYGFDRKNYPRAIQYWQQLLHVAPKHPKSQYIHATMAQFRKAMHERQR
ncbi:MAG: tetratricopeptide repeat protein [Nitrospirota bacterium]